MAIRRCNISVTSYFSNKVSCTRFKSEWEALVEINGKLVHAKNGKVLKFKPVHQADYIQTGKELYAKCVFIIKTNQFTCQTNRWPYRTKISLYSKYLWYYRLLRSPANTFRRVNRKTFRKHRNFVWWKCYRLTCWSHADQTHAQTNQSSRAISMPMSSSSSAPLWSKSNFSAHHVFCLCSFSLSLPCMGKCTTYFGFKEFGIRRLIAHGNCQCMENCFENGENALFVHRVPRWLGHGCQTTIHWYQYGYDIYKTTDFAKDRTCAMWFT